MLRIRWLTAIVLCAWAVSVAQATEPIWDVARDTKTVPARTVTTHLQRFLWARRIGQVKRGVFFVAAPGETAAKSPVDFLLVASRLAPDAVLGYHTALEAHGYAQSTFERLSFLTERKAKPLTTTSAFGGSPPWLPRSVCSSNGTASRFRFRDECWMRYGHSDPGSRTTSGDPRQERWCPPGI